MVQISFEFFPPKSDKGDAVLFAVLEKLKIFEPDYCSVTYGAGGTTKARTAEIVQAIQKQHHIPASSHLTCVNAPKSEINAIAENYWQNGICRIVALRGDMPGMSGDYVPHPEGYAYAHELVSGLKAIGDFDISVACFPETHPEAVSADADLDYLKRKIDAGANRAIMQYCFDTDAILRFIEKARAKGITVPLVPGIMPIQDIKQTISFSKRCGATVPDWLIKRFDGVEAGSADATKLAAEIATDQSLRLIEQAESEELHIYTLNKAEPTVAICEQLPLSS